MKWGSGASITASSVIVDVGNIDIEGRVVLLPRKGMVDLSVAGDLDVGARVNITAIAGALALAATEDVDVDTTADLDAPARDHEWDAGEDLYVKARVAATTSGVVTLRASGAANVGAATITTGRAVMLVWDTLSWSRGADC